MAVYKVPQDVEAEDKLLGPFSFRQFIYLMIVAVAIALAWGLGSLFIPLAIIPLPIIIFFGALALPLKKDQPMEIYLAAVLSFYLKPRKRLWEPDGVTSLIEVTAPKDVEFQRTKNISGSEADKRFSYLANIVDSGGWAIRGASSPDQNSGIVGDMYYEAQQTQDIFDNENNLAQSFNHMMEEKDAKHHQDVIEMMQASNTTSAPPQTNPAAPDDIFNSSPQQPIQDVTTPQLSFNPYPTNIHQSVITPLSDQPAAAQPVDKSTSTNSASPPQPTSDYISAQNSPSTSEKPLSPDIINLANNPDLSIETIAHEAKRIHQKEDQDEVVISLR